MHTIHMLKKASAKLPHNTVPKMKERSGRPRKTNRRLDTILRREVMLNSSVIAREIKFKHPDLFQNVFKRTLKHRLQKDFKILS